MTKKTDTPAIRFKGFSDTWEQRKLLEFGLATGGTSIESEFSEDGVYKVISIGSYSEDNVYRDQGIRAVRSDKTVNRILNKGDITMILNDKTASGNIIGRVLLIEESGVYVYNQRTERIEVDNSNYDSQFIYTMLNAPAIRDRIIKQSQGNTQIYVNWTTISQTDYLVPQFSEQRKIGEYFANLDHLITLHQREYEKLHNIKKSMLEKMFPKNGSNVPEIRFKGFTEAWEQRKLGDVVQITMGQSPDGSTYSDEPSDYILVQGNADLQNGWVCPRIWTTQITKKADAGDLIMSVRAPAGAMGKTAYNAVIGRGVAAIKGNEFIYQLLVKMDADGFWKILSCGSTFESLNSENIKNAEVKIPTTAEQIKIGGYFQQLDNLITLHQRELEKLQNIKKSMLEKMFVSEEKRK